MGSAALKPTGNDLARVMLREVEEEARRSIAATGEVDARVLLQIIDDHQDGPHRDEIRLYLAAYLGRCLTAGIPNYHQWDPFP